MAGSPSGSKPEKSMSSRLLTMKFMQRAAASAAANDSQTPAETPSPKRHRGDASPATPAAQSDLDAISAALAAEEEKRREALNRQAAEAGETEWVLDFDAAPAAPQPRVVVADSLDAEDQVYGGRQSYGNFKRKKKTVNPDGETVTVDSDDEDADALIKREKLRQERNQPVKLHKLTSISGAGGQPSIGRNRSESQSKKKRKQK